MAGYGLEIVERLALETVPNADNERYLRTKAEKLGHLLTLQKPPATGDVRAESRVVRRRALLLGEVEVRVGVERLAVLVDDRRRPAPW